MSDIILDVTAGRERGDAQPLDQTPFRIALLGDWSGRQNRGAVETGTALAGRRSWRVDRDDLDEVMSEMAPALSLRLEPDAPPLGLRFNALDDFHPDRLFDRLPLFRAMRELRDRLKDPATFQAAARELSGEVPPTPARRAPSGGSLLGDILDEATPVDAAEVLAESGGDLHAFIQRIMRPHLIPRPDPRQPELIAEVDAAAGATLRSILHTPAFQGLEALWRAAEFLARGLETSSDLQVHLVDVAESELRLALPANGDPAVSPVYRLLARQAGSAPWALIIGGYTFGAAAEDTDLLAQLAAIGQMLGAPWISAAHPRLVGGDSVQDLADAPKAAPDPSWELFRRTGLAQSLGLVLPRFLGRLPYGRGLEECERLAFEELIPSSASTDMLWVNPAFTVALILGRAFAEHGWAFARWLDPQVTGLPLGVVGKGTEARTVGPGEAPLSERVAERMLDVGFMPLAPIKESDGARLVRFHSVANPSAPLAGRWNRG
jgi:type VI secretion system protein ImpC